MKTRGDSGLDITQVIDDKITIVGTNPNVYPSCRKDGAGREQTEITQSASQGVSTPPSAYTEVEAVDNSGDHHGGTYTIIAMNKFAVDSGAGGIHLSSVGNINLLAGGGIANVVATECASLISNIIKLSAAEITVIKGPKLYIDSDSTAFTNSVKIAKNLIINGGMFVNGELYANHMTMPHQLMETSMSPILPVYFNTPTILKGIITQTCMNPSTCGGLGTVPLTPAVSTNYVQFMLDPSTTMKAHSKVLPHYHTYRHAACTFLESSSKVWEEVDSIDLNEPIKPKKVLNFGGTLDRIVNKCKTRLTNAFTDAVTSLMGNIF